jgi:cell wall-associated NlpC family hydrolase
MILSLRTFVRASGVIGIAMLVFQGCASLEPLPRFRTSSTSFAPDQLPLAQRSTSDLIDPAKIGAYSHFKKEATFRSEGQKPASEVQRLVINRTSYGQSQVVDKVGLENERLEEEQSNGDEFASEEPAVDEGIIQRVIQRGAYTNPEAEGEEVNPAANRVEMMKEIVNILGVRYHYGGMDAVKGLDCSAFTGTIYSRAFGVRLPRSSNEQFGVGSKIRKDNLKIGDLVFFKTRRKRAPVSHVGIYVGDNCFAHASTKHGVIISTLDQGYYNKTYVGARRVLLPQMTELHKK